MPRRIEMASSMFGSSTITATAVGCNGPKTATHVVTINASIGAPVFALGASSIERHITLDRSMWGSDQAASVEPGGLEKLVKYIRVTEASLGDGVKKVYESEKGSMKKLRRVISE